MSYKFVCQRCGCTKFTQSTTVREYCSKCLRILTQRDSKLSPHERPVKPRKWQKYSTENILQDLNWFVRRCSDLGNSGPVVQITPDHPMFEQIARQCTHIKEID